MLFRFILAFYFINITGCVLLFQDQQEPTFNIESEIPSITNLDTLMIKGRAEPNTIIVLEAYSYLQPGSFRTYYFADSSGTGSFSFALPLDEKLILSFVVYTLNAQGDTLTLEYYTISTPQIIPLGKTVVTTRNETFQYSVQTNLYDSLFISLNGNTELLNLDGSTRATDTVNLVSNTLNEIVIVGHLSDLGMSDTLRYFVTHDNLPPQIIWTTLDTSSGGLALSGTFEILFDDSVYLRDVEITRPNQMISTTGSLSDDEKTLSVDYSLTMGREYGLSLKMADRVGNVLDTILRMDMYYKHLQVLGSIVGVLNLENQNSIIMALGGSNMLCFIETNTWSIELCQSLDFTPTYISHSPSNNKAFIFSDETRKFYPYDIGSRQFENVNGITLSSSNDTSLPLLSDDTSYTIRGEFTSGGVGVIVVNYKLRPIVHFLNADNFSVLKTDTSFQSEYSLTLRTYHYNNHTLLLEQYEGFPERDYRHFNFIPSDLSFQPREETFSSTIYNRLFHQTKDAYIISVQNISYALNSQGIYSNEAVSGDWLGTLPNGVDYLFAFDGYDSFDLWDMETFELQHSINFSPEGKFYSAGASTPWTPRYLHDNEVVYSYTRFDTSGVVVFSLDNLGLSF